MAGGVLGYKEPRVSKVAFDPAGIVLDDDVSERLAELLLALASDYEAVSDQKRARSLAVFIRLFPAALSGREANRQLIRGLQPESQMLGMGLKEAVSELWKVASEIDAQAVTEDETQLARYLAAVVLAYADAKDPRFARARKLLGRDGPGPLWKGVL